MKVMAIDPSLNNTAIVILNDNGKDIVEINIIPKTNSIDRLIFIGDEVKQTIKTYNPDYIIIEGYSYNSKGKAILNIAELGGILRVLLYQSKIATYVVPPTTIKKFVCGKGNVKKEIMLLEVFKKWKFATHDNNIADAYAIGKFFVYIKTKNNKLAKELWKKVEILGN